ATPLTRRDGSLNEIRHDIAHRMDGNGEMFKINPGKTIQPPTRASGENSMAVGGMTDGPLRARGAHRDRAHET
ncbi:hypothetical protein, partial [Bacillus thuringiensis]|uniref:hypothetical protein n=1 Tax=Bacillus thuringiensis TaxID=1428 RepID=UPI0015970218